MDSHFYTKEIDEIPAPELNDRGLHAYRGWDASTARQALVLAERYDDLRQLDGYLVEKDVYPNANHLYELTSSGNEQYISHAIGYLGEQGLRIFLVNDCTEAEADDFRDAIQEDIAIHYPEVA